jgi:hypothetical protein
MKDRISDSIVYGISGLFFSFIVGFVAATLGGAGHGTELFVSVVWAPLPFGALIWPIVAASLPWASNYWIAGGICGLLLLNYVTAALAFFKENKSYVSMAMQNLPGIVVFVIACYLAAQVLIYVKLARMIATRRK